jgi:hypothetical protein
MVMENELDEPLLEDDYPIYGGYWYLVDGKPIRSDWHRITASELKKKLNASEVRRCSAVKRGLPLLGYGR